MFSLQWSLDRLYTLIFLGGREEGFNLSVPAWDQDRRTQVHQPVYRDIHRGGTQVRRDHTQGNIIKQNRLCNSLIEGLYYCKCNFLINHYVCWCFCKTLCQFCKKNQQFWPFLVYKGTITLTRKMRIF